MNQNHDELYLQIIAAVQQKDKESLQAALQQWPNFPDEQKRAILGAIHAQVPSLASPAQTRYLPQWLRLFADAELMKHCDSPLLPVSVRGANRFAAYLLQTELRSSLHRHIAFVIDSLTLQALGFDRDFADRFHLTYDDGPVSRTKDNDIKGILMLLQQGKAAECGPEPVDMDELAEALEEADDRERAYFQKTEVRQRLQATRDDERETLVGQAWEVLLQLSAGLELRDAFDQIRDLAPLTVRTIWHQYQIKLGQGKPEDEQVLERLADFLARKRQAGQTWSDVELSGQSWQDGLWRLLQRLAVIHTKGFKALGYAGIKSQTEQEGNSRKPHKAKRLSLLWKTAILFLSHSGQKQWGELNQGTFPTAYLPYENWWEELTALLRERPAAPEFYYALLEGGDPISQYWSYLLWNLCKTDSPEGVAVARKLVISIALPQKNRYYPRIVSHDYLPAILWKAWKNGDGELLANAIERCAVPLATVGQELHLSGVEYPIWSEYAPAPPLHKGVSFIEVWRALAGQQPQRVAGIVQALLPYLRTETLPRLVFDAIAQLSGGEALLGVLPQLLEAATANNKETAAWVLELLTRHPRLCGTAPEKVVQIAAGNLSSMPTPCSQQATLLLASLAEQQPQFSPEILGILAAGIFWETPTMLKAVVSALSSVVQSQIQSPPPQGLPLSQQYLTRLEEIRQRDLCHLGTIAGQIVESCRGGNIRMIPATIDLTPPSGELYKLTDQRVDLHVENESRAWSLSDGEPSPDLVQEEFLEDMDQVARLIEQGQFFPILHDSKVDFCARVVVGQPLTANEEAEWLARVRWKLKIPSGILVIAGGTRFVSIYDPKKPEFVRVLVPPGDYTVTAYLYLHCPYGAGLFYNAKALAGISPQESLVSWFLRSRPGQRMPSWVREFSDYTNRGGDDSERAAMLSQIEMEEDDDPEKMGKLADYERKLLEAKRQHRDFISYLIHLEPSVASLERPALEYGLLNATVRPLPAICPQGIIANLANPPHRSQDNWQDPHQLDVLKQLEHVQTSAVPAVAVALNDLKYLAELAGFFHYHPQLALRLQLPAGQQLGQDWPALLYTEIKATASAWAIRPMGALDHDDSVIWLSRVAAAARSLPVGTVLTLASCARDPESRSADRCWSGPLMPSGVWHIEQVYPASSHDQLEQSIALACATEATAAIALQSEEELVNVVVELSKDLWCPLLERDGLKLRLKSKDLSAFGMSTDSSMRKVAEAIFHRRLGSAWGIAKQVKSYTQAGEHWAQQRKLRRLWIARVVYPPQLFYSGQKLIATRTFPQQIQLILPQEASDMDMSLQQLGFTYLGDFYGEQFPNLFLRGYANAQEHTYAVFYFKENETEAESVLRPFEFCTEFTDNASWTTCRIEEFSAKPNIKSFGAKYPQASVEELWQYHRQALQQQAKERTARAIEPTLEALAATIDRSLLRQE